MSLKTPQPPWIAPAAGALFLGGMAFLITITVLLLYAPEVAETLKMMILLGVTFTGCSIGAVTPGIGTAFLGFLMRQAISTAEREERRETYYDD